MLDGCFLDDEQKTSVDKPDERAAQSSSSQIADVPAASSTQDDVISGERQQHGALPDLLPPQIPPRANQPDKSTSEEVSASKGEIHPQCLSFRLI